MRLTAMLVDHFPVFSAFAFRFDTQEGSVVFSGEDLAQIGIGTRPA